MYQIYKWFGWECSDLRAPVKAYGAISEFGGGEGQWFENGCIVFRYNTGQWHTYIGDYGQTAGR